MVCCSLSIWTSKFKNLVTVAILRRQQIHFLCWFVMGLPAKCCALNIFIQSRHKNDLDIFCSTKFLVVWRSLKQSLYKIINHINLRTHHAILQNGWRRQKIIVLCRHANGFFYLTHCAWDENLYYFQTGRRK